MKGTLRLVLACLVLVLGAGCIGWSSSAADRRRESVSDGPSIGSVQIYSGRVPPSWQLSDTVRAELVRAMALLQAVPQAG